MPTTSILRIVTFNIWNVWRKSRKAWNRDDLAAGVLLSQNPDIICLQEFDGPFREETVSLPQMISGLFEEVVPPNVAKAENWNPIFYRRERFDVLSCGHRVYRNGTEYPYRETQRSHFRTLTWALLKEKGNGRICAVINTHFDTNEDHLQSESDELLEVVSEIRKRFRACVLVAGDYNCRAKGIAVQNLMQYGFQDTHSLAERKEACAGCHPYPIQEDGKEGFDTYDNHFYAVGYEDAIDHVMVLGNAAVYSYRTVINEATLLISDHSPVVVDLCFQDSD